MSASIVFLLIKEYTLNGDEKEKGTNRRTKAIAHKVKNVFLGSLLIAKVRITITTKINREAEKLVCSILIKNTSFHIADNLF